MSSELGDVPLTVERPAPPVTTAKGPARVPFHVDIQGKDATVKYAQLMGACGPNTIRSRAAIEKVGKCISEGAVVFILCGAPMRSQIQNVFLKQAFAPLARRIQRGALLQARKHPILFFNVSFPHMSTDDPDALREMQTSVIDSAWDGIVDGKWLDGHERPEFYIDGVLTNANGIGWQFFDIAGEWQEPRIGLQRLTRALLSSVNDPTLLTVTVDKLKDLHSKFWDLDVSMSYDGLASRPGVIEKCPIASSFQDLGPCITDQIKDLRQEDLAGKFRTEYPQLRAVLFLPVGYIPFPRLATPLHVGVWSSVHELADAVLGHVLSHEHLPSRLLILPWDAIDMPNIPEVSCIDLHTQLSYAYGDVAKFLLTELNVDGKSKTLKSREFAHLPETVAGFVKTSCGKSCVLNELRKLSSSVLEQQLAWSSRAPVQNAAARMRGCLADQSQLLLPYSMSPFVRDAIIARPVSRSQISELVAESVAGVRISLFKDFDNLSKIKLNTLKGIVAFAASRKLVDPWQLVFFQHASNDFGCHGTKQILRAFLQDGNGSVVYFLLRNVVLSVKTPLPFEASIADRRVDVMPSAFCTVGEHVATEPVSAESATARDQHFAYDVDKWGASALVGLPESDKSAAELKLEDKSSVTTAAGEAVKTMVPTQGGAMFDLAVLPEFVHQQLPYVRMHGLSLQKSFVPFLLHFSKLDDEAVSCFFAGTRYMIKEDTFEYSRTSLGNIVAVTCGPTVADAYLVINNFPLYLQTASNVLNTVMQRNGALDAHIRELFVWMMDLQAAFQARALALERGETPLPLAITEEQYEELQDMAVKDAHAFLQSALVHRQQPSDIVTWVVYGRFDKVELDEEYPGQNLRPCPRTVEAVDLLRSRGQDVVVHEVPNAMHASIPLLKPVEHNTVPVVFKQRQGHGLRFIGGCDEVKHLFAGESN